MFSNLDEVVLDALSLFERGKIPILPFEKWQNPLVLGSGNAIVVGRLLFEDQDAYFADESTYKQIVSRYNNRISQAIIISASGGKDAVRTARALGQWGIGAWLLTNTADAPASEYIDPTHVFVFPKNREPYTYNVSTYMGMLLSKTHEDSAALKKFIKETVTSQIPDTFGQYDAFYFIIPPQFILLKELFLTKFDELFGSMVSARVFTLEQSKHARTLVPSDTECFISFGEENTLFGNEKNRFHISLPENAEYAALMAIGYYVFGRFRKQDPPYFKDNIVAYAKIASELFGEHITPIVE